MIGAMEQPPTPDQRPFPPSQPTGPIGEGGGKRARPEPMPEPRPDPGTPRAARTAWLVLLVALPLVVAMQQWRAHSKPELDPAAIHAPMGDNVETNARFGTRLGYALGPAGAQFQNNVDEAASTPLQRLRAAISAGELIGPDEAARRLAGIIDDLEQVDPGAFAEDDANARAKRALILEDARVLREHYESIAINGSGTQPLEVDVLEGLVARHGYFAELVGVAHLPANHERRRDLLGGALVPLVVMVLVMCLVGLGLLAALGLGITAIVLLGQRRIEWTMCRPLPGGSVYLESVAVFVVAFAALQGAGKLASMIGSPVDMIVGTLSLPAQWLLLLCPLWPLLRGVSWAQVRDDLGLRAPKGWMIEVLAGIAGYLALLPLVLVGVGVMLLLLWAQGQFFPADPDGPGASNPILDMIQDLNPVTLVLLYTMATIWAPLCEELVFRGAMLRHLRARLVLPLAAVLSAMVFGLMHGYMALQLIPVTILGFNFALLRAWRGSLVGPIAAHALNNAVVLALLYSVAFVMYG